MDSAILNLITDISSSSRRLIEALISKESDGKMFFNKCCDEDLLL